jgi:hypothetical protein
MKVTIQTLDKKTVDVEIDADKTIGDLKKEIEKVKDHPHDLMKLIFNGAVLEDNNKSLQNYGVVSESKLILLMQKKKAVEQPIAETTKTTESAPIVSSASQIPPLPAMPSSLMGSSPLVIPLTLPASGQQGSLSMAQIFTGLLQQNPQMAQQLTAQTGQSFEGLVGQLEQLASEIEQEEQLYNKVFSGGDISLADNEKLEVEEIVSMGLGSFEDVVQFYQACDKNKEQTINMLLNDNLDN